MSESFQNTAATQKQFIEDTADLNKNDPTYFEKTGACLLKLTATDFYAQFADTIQDNKDNLPDDLLEQGLLGPEFNLKGNGMAASLSCTKESLLIDTYAAQEASPLFSVEQRCAPTLFFMTESPQWISLKGATSDKPGYTNQDTTTLNDIKVVPAGFVAITPCVVYFAPHELAEADKWAVGCFTGDDAPLVPEQETLDAIFSEDEHLVRWTLSAGDMFLSHHGNPVKVMPVEGDEDACLIKFLGFEAVSSETKIRSKIKGFYNSIFTHNKVVRGLHHENHWLYHKNFKVKADDDKMSLVFDAPNLDDFPQYRKVERGPGKKKAETPKSTSSDNKADLLAKYDALIARANALSPLVFKADLVEPVQEMADVVRKEDACAAKVLHQFERRIDTLTKRITEAETDQEKVAAFEAQAAQVLQKLNGILIPAGKGTKSLRKYQEGYVAEMEVLSSNAKNFTFSKLKKSLNELEEKVNKQVERVEAKRFQLENGGGEAAAIKTEESVSPLSYANIKAPIKLPDQVEDRVMHEKEASALLLGIMKENNEAYKSLGKTIDMEDVIDPIYDAFFQAFKTARADFHKAREQPNEADQMVNIGRFLALHNMLGGILAEKSKIDADYEARKATFVKRKRVTEYESADCKHPRRKVHANNMCFDCFRQDVLKRMGFMNESEKKWDADCCEKDKETKELEFVNGSSEEAQQWDTFKDKLAELDEFQVKCSKQPKNTELAQEMFNLLLKVEDMIPLNYRVSNMDFSINSDEDEDDEEIEYADSDLEENYNVPDDAPISYHSSDEDEESSAVFSEDDSRSKKKRKEDEAVATSIIHTFHAVPVEKERELAMDAFCKGDMVAAKGVVALVRNSREVHGFTMKNKNEQDEEPEEYPVLFLDKKDAVQRKRIWSMISDNFYFQLFSRPVDLSPLKKPKHEEESPEPMDLDEDEEEEEE